jgi:two-component system, OmpR family, sensor kinase
MGRSRISRVRTMAGRLRRAPLRLKVMSGVVAVTLIALAAFDVGAVATMRRYLLAQTDNSLQLAMTVTTPKLNSLLAGGFLRQPAGGAHNARATRSAKPPQGKVPAFPGAFDIVFVPSRGDQVPLEVSAAPGVRALARSHVPPSFMKLISQPGLHTTVAGQPGTAFRLESARVKGGYLVVGASLDQVTSTVDRVELIVAVGSVAVVLLIGLGVFVVVRRGLRPIEAMARQADRITGGDLTGRVAPDNARSEVGRLGAALNGMLTRIEASQQETRRFFTDASHELRTPLASLRANAQLYQQGAVQDPDEVNEVMGRIVQETRRMGRLVDDMLRLARLGQQPGQSREPIDLTAVVRGCVERARVADLTRTWEVQLDDGLTVTGDEELLRRAVDNLLTNVLVHTPGDTVGSISASVSGDHVVLVVADDGPGVAPDQLPHIFERFYRAGARSRSGSGLGLAIVTEIAAAHGGTLQAAPVSPHGLRTTLVLPVSEPAALKIFHLFGDMSGKM